MKQQTADITLRNVPITITEDKDSVNISFKIPEGEHHITITPINS